MTDDKTPDEGRQNDTYDSTRITVLRQSCRCNVDEHPSAPDPHVGEVQVSERDRRRALIADQPFQHRIIGVGP